MNGSRPGTRSAPALSGRRPGTAASNASLPTAAKQSNIKVTVRIRPLHVKKTASAADVDGDSHFASTATLAAQNAGDGFNLPLTLSSHDFFLHQQQVYNKRTVSPIDDQLLVFDPTGPTSHGTPMDQDGPATPHKGRLQLGKKHKNICYGFDRIFPEDVTQHEVYEETAKPLIEGVLDGYNSTVFAYGATGCGKTYTITGTEDQPGVIYRTMEDLFARMRELERERVIEAELSYLEVYNEQIRDLLKDQPPLELREDDKGVQVAKLSKHVLLDVEDVMALLIRGNENRSKAPTEANETSSRSHAVLQIHVKQRDRGSGTQATWKTAILSIIDLAGSERASATKNRGERLREGAKINRSLLALGNCINALCKSVHSRHIPYRDSKLTRLLKFSLGGNCKVVMIANISPHPSYYEETHNTLMYANRAKEIKTKVEQNRVNVEAGVEEYTRIIAELEDQVKHLREQLELARSAGVKGDPSGGKAVYDQVANSRALQFLRDRLLPRSLKQELARESIAAEMALVQRQKALCTSLKESVWGSEYDVDLSQLKGAISQAEKDIERRLQDLGTRLSDALVVLGELDGLANRVVEKADQTFAARDLEDGDQSWTIKVFNDFVSAARRIWRFWRSMAGGRRI
ncbi:kinesin-domain-containing protein [Hyaloraphidium curvatum]|nr:kinesin-domain-containing protein [Hyaloraphidium curvatum]